MATAETLLRAGFARCGYCGRGMVVSRHPRWKTRYICGCRNPGDLCAEIPSIGAAKLDRLAWADVVKLILEPDKIREGIEQILASEDAGADLASLDRALAELQHKQQALVSNLALLDADSAELAREQLAGLSAQRRTLEAERTQNTERHVERQTQQERLKELSAACELVASNLNNLTYENKSGWRSRRSTFRSGSIRTTMSPGTRSCLGHRLLTGLFPVLNSTSQSQRSLIPVQRQVLGVVFVDPLDVRIGFGKRDGFGERVDVGFASS
jgi:hypothetical protein